MKRQKAGQASMDHDGSSVSDKSTLNNNKAAPGVALPSENVHNILYTLPWSRFSIVTVSLPLWSLVFCFVTACIFQHDSVTDTECHVTNDVPSISAVTGVSPQRYVWRICIALHSAPRFAVGFAYYNFYMAKIDAIAEKHKALFKRLVNVNFWLYTVENACLVGVTYISNVDNYPVHEKMFVVFMFSALVYELLTIILFRWCHEDPLPPHLARSLKWKKRYFTFILASTVGLLYFFVRHRFFCEPGAFSFFSAFEYGIAITNIGFHYTAAEDFKGSKWFLGLPSSTTSQNSEENHVKVQ